MDKITKNIKDLLEEALLFAMKLFNLVGLIGNRFYIMQNSIFNGDSSKHEDLLF